MNELEETCQLLEQQVQEQQQAPPTLEQDIALLEQKAADLAEKEKSVRQDQEQQIFQVRVM